MDRRVCACKISSRMQICISLPHTIRQTNFIDQVGLVQVQHVCEDWENAFTQTKGIPSQGHTKGPQQGLGRCPDRPRPGHLVFLQNELAELKQKYQTCIHNDKDLFAEVKSQRFIFSNLRNAIEKKNLLRPVKIFILNIIIQRYYSTQQTSN